MCRAKQSLDSKHLFGVDTHDGGEITTQTNSGVLVDHCHLATGLRGDSSFTSVADRLFELHQKACNSKQEVFPASVPSAGTVASSYPNLTAHSGRKDPKDVSFVPADELSELLNESSVERHLDRAHQPTPDHSDPQIDDPASPTDHRNTTHERDSAFGGHRQTPLAPQVGVGVAHHTLINGVVSSSMDQPSRVTATGRDGWSTGITSSETGAGDGVVGDSILQSEPRISKLRASFTSETGTKNDGLRLDPGSESRPKPHPDSEVSPNTKLKHQGEDNSLTGGIQEHSSSTARSSVDVYHLALQVRDKLSGMFDPSPAGEKVSSLE